MFLFVAMFTNTQTTSVYPLRIMVGLTLILTVWCIIFIKDHGMLYVNWPKLNNLIWANEGYNDALGKVAKDKLIGKWVARHERGASSIRLMHLEEGKKRIE